MYDRIRKTEIAELGILMELFEQGKRIMRKSGNMKQWTGGYPNEELVKKDIENGNSYVCLDEEQNIVGTFTFIQGNDPTYARIYEGAWSDDTRPYGVIHRLASTEQSKGVASACLQWCYRQIPNLRADTHRDNHILQHILKNTASNIAASYTCRMETNGWPFRSCSDGTRTKLIRAGCAILLLQLLHGCSGEILFHEIPTLAVGQSIRTEEKGEQLNLTPRRYVRSCPV